jgi:hypothetical protein
MPRNRAGDAANADLTLFGYEGSMDEAPITDRTEESVEAVLRDELARGDRVLADARPILRHLVANDDHALFADATIARIRGMMLDVAGQLLFAQAMAARAADPGSYISERQDELAQALSEDGTFLSHAHALVLEAQLTERLAAHSGLDPVLPPLIQELAADPDPTTAERAMAVLAAQARFLQHSRRMALPLRELPGDLFHKALLMLRARAGGEAAKAAERQLRDGYDEGASRLGLVSRLVLGTEGDRARMLSVDRAGLAIFATALTLAAQQERDVIVLSFADGRLARLSLALRAAGLGKQAAETQLLLLHPDFSLPAGFEALPADRAASLLAAAGPGLA